MHVTILGTGHMARTIGEGLQRVGHSAVFGSRTPQDATDLPGPAASHSQAIVEGELVVNALAAAHSLAVLSSLAKSIESRVVIDIGNAVTEQLELIYPDGSLGERLQAALPQSRIVKTLNTVGGPIGVDPSVLTGETNVFLSGDDEDAKRLVAGLLTDLGWAGERQIDLGGIETSRAVEHYFLLFASLMGALRTPEFNLAIVR